MGDIKKEHHFSGASHELETPVLLIFFNRYEQFKKVFDAVKNVKPAKIFLYQDGLREGKNDLEGILRCRTVLEEIDWECDVSIWFREKNCGCDPSEYLSQKWAFSCVEKCIVLEDDDVPCRSFFFFCQEMLNKYEHDQRINAVCGMNHLERYNEEYGDYFFSTICSIWGWASWKRVVDEWDSNYDYLKDQHTVDTLMEMDENSHVRNIINASQMHKETGKAFYETIFASQMFLTHRLNIIPSVNLISNIGIAATSTHATDSIEKVPHGLRRVFNMKTYEMQFPLKEPKYMVEDITYQKKVKKLLAWGHPFIRFFRRIDSMLLKIKWNLTHGFK